MLKWITYFNYIIQTIAARSNTDTVDILIIHVSLWLNIEAGNIDQWKAS